MCEGQERARPAVYGRRMKLRRIVLLLAAVCAIASAVLKYGNAVENNYKEDLISTIDNQFGTEISPQNFTVIDSPLNSLHHREVLQSQLALPSAVLIGVATVVDLLFQSHKGLIMSKVSVATSLLITVAATFYLTATKDVKQADLYSVLPHCAPEFDSKVLWVTQTVIGMYFTGILASKSLVLLLVMPPTINRIVSFTHGKSLFHESHSRAALLFTSFLTPMIASLPLILVRNITDDDVVSTLALLILILPPVVGVITVLVPCLSFTLVSLTWNLCFTGLWIAMGLYVVAVNPVLWEEYVRPALGRPETYLDFVVEVSLPTIVITDLLLTVMRPPTASEDELEQNDQHKGYYQAGNSAFKRHHHNEAESEAELAPTHATSQTLNKPLLEEDESDVEDE